VPGSVVVNIGDLLAKVSGGRWVATKHRVRSSERVGEASKGRYSIPFFFEPGMNCVVESVGGEEVVYGKYVLEKMGGWVEYQGTTSAPQMVNTGSAVNAGSAVDALFKTFGI